MERYSQWSTAYHTLVPGKQYVTNDAFFNTMRQKLGYVQNLDSGLDYGLDYGLNYGLNFGLDWTVNSVPELLSKEDFESCITQWIEDRPNGKNRMSCVQLLARLAGQV